ncbi:MAG: hypothetical protein DMF78_17335 [Acidobacteria bacterium]|nr:MAG: hypothetical protein DMF78_17335 [Acidobacteriota bacterium]
MTDFVSKRVSIVAVVASLLILWGIIVVPGGPAWPGFVSLGALAVLLVATTKLILGAASPAAMSEVIRGVEGEKAGEVVGVRGHSAAAR